MRSRTRAEHVAIGSMLLLADEDAPSGEHSLTFRASDEGVPDATASCTLTVGP